MAERGIDLLIVLPQSDPIDVLYLSGGEQGAVLFPSMKIPGSCSAARTATWRSTARAGSPNARARRPTARPRSPTARQSPTSSRGSKLKPPRVGIAGLDGDLYSHVRSADGYTIYSSVRRIIDVLDGCEIVNGAPVMAHARYVKSEAEIAGFRAGIEVAEAGARAIGEAYSIGKAQADAYRAGIAAMLQPRSRRSVDRVVPGAVEDPDGRGSSAPRRVTSTTASAWRPRSCRARG